MTAGYSTTPLAKKLGIKNGFVIKIVNMPSYYFELFPDMPYEITIQNAPAIPKDLIHFFTKDFGELDNELPKLKKEIKPNGSIWVSWPKKAAKVPTNVTEDRIRLKALEIGLVDIKVCAVDDTWSGLKLVIPVKKRSGEAAK